MARIWTISIQYGPIKARAELTHVYPDGRDEPWRRVEGDKDALPETGWWAHHQKDRPEGVVSMWSAPDRRDLADLYGFKNLVVGLIGHGIFLGSGFSIPFDADVYWEVLTIR